MAIKSKPSFNYAVCINCGVCMQTCPVSCIEMIAAVSDKHNALFPKVRDDTCTGCALCEKGCPVEAVAMV